MYLGNKTFFVKVLYYVLELGRSIAGHHLKRGGFSSINFIFYFLLGG